ncbi:MAG: TetR/AcrR family transcriptional regulator [Solirubrobacterales bacterium]
MATATTRDQTRRTRQEVRARIVAAATGLIRRRSYGELSVDEVMRAAGLGRTIFYRHFDDLGDLLIRVSQEAIEELYEAQPPLEDVTPGQEVEAIRRALEPAVEVYRRHGPLLRAVAEAARSDRELARGHAAMRRRFTELNRRYLGEAQERGAAPLSDVAETAEAMTVMSEAYLLDAFGREPRVSVEVAVRTLSEIWLALVRLEPTRGAESR